MHTLGAFYQSPNISVLHLKTPFSSAMEFLEAIN